MPRAFGESLYRALVPEGILSVPIRHGEILADWMTDCRDIWDTVEIAMVPTLSCGPMGFLLLARKHFNNNNNDCSSTGSTRPSRGGRALSCRVPVRQPRNASQLKWYSPAMHRAAFVLPPLVQAQLKEYYIAEEEEQVLDDRPLLVVRNGGGSRHQGELENTEPQYHCFCKDLADSLPHRIKNLYTDISSDTTATTDRGNTEDGKCFPRVPLNCTIS